MKKDAKTMKKVAERCTQYAPNGECHCTNSTAGDNVTCKNCTHYEPDEVCTLHLYKEIAENHVLMS